MQIEYSDGVKTTFLVLGIVAFVVLLGVLIADSYRLDVWGSWKGK